MERDLMKIGREMAAYQDEVDGDLVDYGAGQSRLLRAAVRRSAVFTCFRALAAAAALLIVFGLAAMLKDRSATFRVGSDSKLGALGAWIAAPNDTSVPISFEDSSVFRLEPGARARVSEVDPRGAIIVVERGKLSASVVPRPHNRWRVDVGPFQVVVAGTVFDVEWQPDNESFSIALYRGKVILSGPIVGAHREVEVGERLEVSVGRGELKREDVGKLVQAPVASTHADVSSTHRTDESELESPTALASTQRIGESLPEGASAHRAGPETAAVSIVEVSNLANAGRYDQALREAERAGFERLCRTSSADEVLMLGDVARLAGNLSRADLAYLAARRRFFGRHAAQAAFMLGRMAQDQKGAFGDAAAYFATYLQEAPDGPFAREAASRLVESRRKAGDHDGARAAAAHYLSRYPDGPFANSAKEVIFGPQQQ